MQYKEITNKSEWEGFIADSKIQTSFFQSWNWGEFQISLGKRVKRFGFYDEDNLYGVAQAVEIRAKRGDYLYVRNGPILRWDDKDKVQFIINVLKDYAKRNGFWFVRMSPLVMKDNQNVNLISNYPISPMADVDALDTWILDVTQSEEDIQKDMRKSTRYDIRKAKKLGVEIIKSQNVEDIDKFFPIYEDTIKRQQWTGYTKEYIKKQFATYIKDNQANLFLAKYQGEYIAASIFIYHGDSSYYHYSGSLTDFRKIPAPALIQWQNILEAKSRGLEKYNFWGIAPENKPNHPWKGLSFFKMGFGGQDYRWLPTRDLPVSWQYWMTHVFEALEKKRKGY